MYHGTYESVLPRILKPSGALRPGGARGAGARTNVYFALADDREYTPSYSPKFEQFRVVRKEPYSFRYNCQVVVRYLYQLVHRIVGPCLQTGSLAALGPNNAEIPFECIDMVTDWEGWVIFENPVGIVGQDSSISSASTVCPSCRRACTLGLTYCLYCCVLSPGRSDRNIFHKDPRQETDAAMPAGGNSLAEPPTDAAFKRHGDPEVAELIAKATLYTVTEKQKRGPSQRSDLQRRNPSAAFSNYCREVLRRTNRPKGFPLSADLGGEIVFFMDVPEHLRLRQSWIMTAFLTTLEK